MDQIRRKGNGTPNESQTGERLRPCPKIYNVSNQEKTKMGILQNVQTFLESDSDFPQVTFDGQHDLNIQILDADVDYSQDDLHKLVESVFECEEFGEVTKVICALVRDRINVLTGNAARAEKTRAPKVGSTQSKSWTNAIESKDYETALSMFTAIQTSADLFGISSIQLEKLQTELKKIEPKKGS